MGLFIDLIHMHLFDDTRKRQKMFSTARKKLKYSFRIGSWRALEIKHIIFVHKTNEPDRIRVNFYLF